MLGNLLGRLMGQGGGSVTFDELKAASETASAHIVDVREPGEFAAGHVPGAINLPLSRFDVDVLPTGKPVILMCLSGARSGRAHAACQGIGRDDIRHYSGGFSGWASHGGRIER